MPSTGWRSRSMHFWPIGGWCASCYVTDAWHRPARRSPRMKAASSSARRTASGGAGGVAGAIEDADSLPASRHRALNQPRQQGSSANHSRDLPAPMLDDMPSYSPCRDHGFALPSLPPDPTYWPPRIAVRALSTLVDNALNSRRRIDDPIGARHERCYDRSGRGRGRTGPERKPYGEARSALSPRPARAELGGAWPVLSKPSPSPRRPMGSRPTAAWAARLRASVAANAASPIYEGM